MTSFRALSGQERVVIVVDDDPAVRNSLKFSLEIEGFAVRIYRGGGDLLDDADLPSNGCLVIDYQMPEMNGLELLKKLRSHRIFLPAIIVTSHPTSALRAHAAATGAPIVEKPFLGNALINGIRDAFAHQISPSSDATD